MVTTLADALTDG